MFVYGIYIWGCAWEKTTGELQDAPPRSGYATLPVVHLTCWPANEKPILQDSNRASETYQCPVYASRIATRETIMELDVRREGIPSTRWALRGLSATIRPYWTQDVRVLWIDYQVLMCCYSLRYSVSCYKIVCYCEDFKIYDILFSLQTVFIIFMSLSCSIVERPCFLFGVCWMVCQKDGGKDEKIYC